MTPVPGAVWGCLLQNKTGSKLSRPEAAGCSHGAGGRMLAVHAADPSSIPTPHRAPEHCQVCQSRRDGHAGEAPDPDSFLLWGRGSTQQYLGVISGDAGP